MSRFRSPKTPEEEEILLKEATPKTTVYNTKWALKAFRDWQENRENKSAFQEGDESDQERSKNIQDLTVSIEEMSVQSLNFWLSKFVCEVAKQNGERYPPKSIYLLICGINRYLLEVKGEDGVNILAKGEKRQVH